MTDIESWESFKGSCRNFKAFNGACPVPPQNSIMDMIRDNLLSKVSLSVCRLIDHVLIMAYDMTLELANADNRLTRVQYDERKDYEEFWLDYNENAVTELDRGKWIAAIQYTYNMPHVTHIGQPEKGYQISISFTYTTCLKTQIDESIITPDAAK